MPAAAKHAVILYGRPGCPLCDEAVLLLRTLEQRLGFTTRVVNIETDDALHKRFAFEIPVIEVDGVVIARAPIYPRTLEAELGELFAP